FHGGGAISTVPRRQYVAFDVMPYLESGWNVVNIEYDVPGRTVAPIAVQNGICALRWVVANAKEHGFDVDRIVTSGYSSGGWMALMTAMTAGTPAWDGPCAASATARVAGVVSWSAPSDLPDLLEGPNAKGWTAQWFTTLPERLAIAKAVSPITLVRSGLPPVLSIHGDTDGTVPYAQSVRLHEALRRAKVPEKLLTVSGGHGFYPRAEQERIFGEITTFLLTHGLSPKR
ncbi:MAG TPA: prolyl oligopeptidase family serine peptidase, partial [Nitrospira sp.]|nr:prolyl oligopeptidase family serine peptidase [Nitrospira sp.]